MKSDTVLFDINETVLNLSSLKPKFEMAFGEKGVTSLWFSMLLQNSQVFALTKAPAHFAALAAIMIDSLAAQRNININQKTKEDLLDSFANLKPWPDVAPALALLRNAGFRTVAFSNSSQDLITRQIQNSGLGDLFDRVLSVEASKSFKPDQVVYLDAALALDRTVENLRLIACHDWDTHGALSAGLKAAYINRSNAPYHPLFLKADIMGDNMEEIAKRIILAN